MSMMKMLNDEELDNVSGGSIVFNGDCTMCGYNCNNQCMVNDLDSVVKYIDENKYTMTEKQMMREMIAQGWLTYLG